MRGILTIPQARCILNIIIPGQCYEEVAMRAVRSLLVLFLLLSSAAVFADEEKSPIEEGRKDINRAATEVGRAVNKAVNKGADEVNKAAKKIFKKGGKDKQDDKKAAKD